MIWRHYLNLSVWSGSRGCSFDYNAWIFEIAELATFKLLLNLSLEIFKLHLDSVVHISVVHVFLGEETWLPLSLLALVLHQPLPCLLVLYRPLIRGCSYITKLSVLKVTLAYARLSDGRGGDSIALDRPALLTNEVSHGYFSTGMVLLIIAY